MVEGSMLEATTEERQVPPELSRPERCGVFCRWFLPRKVINRLLTDCINQAVRVFTQPVKDPPEEAGNCARQVKTIPD
jgi:hypothetical protein